MDHSSRNAPKSAAPSGPDPPAAKPAWDERFSAPELPYGAEPNDFLAAVADLIPPGPVLCLAEGGGRNAVFLAARGHEVTAMDGSRVGLERAGQLAAARGVSLHTVHADLEGFRIEAGAWAGIVSIWAHVPAELRRRVHADVVAGLAPGGAFVLEAYSPRQLEFGTGGPGDPTRLVTLDALREELAGLDLEIGRELEREIHEGTFHHGRSAVVQVLARKPAQA